MDHSDDTDQAKEPIEHQEPHAKNEALPVVKVTPGLGVTPSSGSAMHSHAHVPSGRVRFLSIALLLIVSGCFGFLGGWLGSKSNDQTATTQKQQVVLKTQGQLISNIAQKVGQSVVSVDVTTSANYGSGTFLNFGQSTPSTTQQSAGTGIILTSDGLIVTNRHVVPSGTTSVSVTLSDGTTFDNVKVVGRTKSNDNLDIAFLKIQDTQGKKLVPAEIGNSSTVNIGDSVIAIGNALGQFQNTVTAGIISGHGRSVQASDSSGSSSENLDDLFQTDAAINEGNSGGPLVNLDGQVIGINTAIANTAQNIGFAIPINDVSGIIKNVEQTGTFQRPYLGVVFVSLTDDIAKQYNLSVSRGAYVPTADALGQDPIVSGSPAEKAGLKGGDIIIKVNGAAIDQNTSLTSLLGKYNVGDKVTLTVVRGGKTITIDAALGAAPTDNS
ncbi:MAG TPA: trypsin-like peptidase domain-containing protein [Candidatus Saccharimonadales bacterium]|nr:trypsin-like peptidase domain-containing protein [Candidatus Saccharimonadales bacterium]